VSSPSPSNTPRPTARPKPTGLHGDRREARIRRGEKLKLVSITILNDGLRRRTRRSAASGERCRDGAGESAAATITIADNDPGVQFEYNKFWVRESDSGLTVEVSRGNDVELGAFTVDYATANLTATAGEDYAEAKDTPVCRRRQGEAAHDPDRYDEVAEQDETFTLTLSHLTGLGALGATAKATVTILDATGMEAHRSTASPSWRIEALN